MEKRVLGIILSLLGIAGLIMAAVNFMNGGADNRNIKEILIYGILGAIFFFAGIGLVRSTRDKAT
jgi:predicted Na+-dependent transporter